MSRIQDILNKAERDGTARRTRGLSADGPPPAVLSSADVPPVRPPEGAFVQPPLFGQPPSWTTPPPAPSVDPELREAPATELDGCLVAALAPHSLAAEQYRSLRTRIKRTENGRPIRAIVITSPAKGDGKSLTAANLAITMAQEFQQRILLVDADLRRPAVHRLFGLPEGPGLSDVLMGAVDLTAGLLTLPEHRLTVLTAGTACHHPAELLGSTSMRRVLDTLRTRFDRILIDMPPVAPLADLQVVAPMADGVLMIVRAGVTPKPAIEGALAGLDRAKVLGLVLNETGGPAAGAAGYEGYGYIAG